MTPPKWLTEYGFVMGVIGFFLFATSRKWLFNHNGHATGLLIIAAMAGALVGGYLYKGKSGWCSSICPLYPVQRFYNRTPLVTVPNAHCTPCVGCTKNCYDFNPGTAYLADMYDDDRHYASYRKFFAAAMPGFIVAYFTLPDPSGWTAVIAMYLQFALYMVLSVGVFTVLDTLFKGSSAKLTAVYGAVAINLFYRFGLPNWLKAVGSAFGVTPPLGLAWALQAGILIVSVIWVARTFHVERQYLRQVQQGEMNAAPAGQSQQAGITFMPDGWRAPADVGRPMNPSAITFMPTGVEAPIEIGHTLLEIAENHNQPLEAGCRMGICGADPVLIVNGMENLPPIGKEEKNTLERLGLGPNCRLACMCRVKGPVAVSLETEGAAAATAVAAAPVMDYDRGIKSIVIIGNGAAGITAADTVRRHHPECEIHLVSREKHHFYNRMAITRLIYGRSAMSGLYMQPEAWYDQRKITCWLNTHATEINRGRKHVILATGDSLAYDRLILAMGSSSFVPPLPGYGLPGSFVLREAEEAMEIRAYVQNYQCRTAVIAGGGLLGLETAYALYKMGLTVRVLERGEWLLRRQLDERGGQRLKEYLEALGLIIETSAEAAGLEGEERVSAVTLKDGRSLPCDVFMVAAGIQPNVDLARAAGLRVNRGVVVDEAMRTSALDIYAAGDVCEYDQQVPGLWAVALEQAKVAAINAVGSRATYAEVVPVTTLKVAGVDLTSMGRIEVRSEQEMEIAQEAADGHGYRKLVIADGKLVGAILLGDAQNTPAIAEAVKEKRDVSHCLEALRAGRWEVLGDNVVATAGAALWVPASLPASRPEPEPSPAPDSTAAQAEYPVVQPAVANQHRQMARDTSTSFDARSAPRTPRRIVRKVRARSKPSSGSNPDPQPATAGAEPLRTTTFRTIIIDFGRKRGEADSIHEHMA